MEQYFQNTTTTLIEIKLNWFVMSHMVILFLELYNHVVDFI